MHIVWSHENFSITLEESCSFHAIYLDMWLGDYGFGMEIRALEVRSGVLVINIFGLGVVFGLSVCAKLY